MPLTRGSKEVLGDFKKPKSPETTPKTNEQAKKKAGEYTKQTKETGAKRIDVAKKRNEKKEKPKVVVLTICGKEIERKKVGGKIVFREKGKQTSIGSLAVWVEKQLEILILQKQIDKDLKPFVSSIKRFTDATRDKVVKKLNSTKFSRIESGKIDIEGEKTEDPVKKAAYLASTISSQVGARSLTVSASSLNRLKHKKYLDYQHILPANVRTIIVMRGDKKMVCSRTINDPGKGGRISYVNVVTGERIYLKGGDKIRIVGTVSVASEAYKRIAKAEKTYIQIRTKAHRIWLKNSDQSVSTMRRVTASSYGSSESSASVGHSVSSSSSFTSSSSPVASSASSVSPAFSASSAPSALPTFSAPPAKLAPAPASFKETPEEMKQNCTQETFKLPGRHMFASMLSPNLKKYPKLKDSKPKLIVYFAGRGHYKAIQAWYKAHGPVNEPPPEVLAKAAREDFLSSKKRIFAILESRWEKGENVHFVLASHMRSYLSGNEKDSGASKYWYRELWNQSSASALFGVITSKFKEKSGATSVKNIDLVGHSMGGKALVGISRLHLPYKFSYFYSDATYWVPEINEVLHNKDHSLYISYRVGTKTEKIAKSIIARLHLKGYRRGKETVFTNPKYPNVRIVATSVSHSENVGQYLNPALELASRAKAGKLQSVA
ncbi:hypothetical protein J7J83_01260 [bacterium]|nr:hypothetical protein [bacterium]